MSQSYYECRKPKYDEAKSGPILIPTYLLKSEPYIASLVPVSD